MSRRVKASWVMSRGEPPSHPYYNMATITAIKSFIVQDPRREDWIVALAIQMGSFLVGLMTFLGVPF